MVLTARQEITIKAFKMQVGLVVNLIPEIIVTRQKRKKHEKKIAYRHSIIIPLLFLP